MNNKLLAVYTVEYISADPTVAFGTAIVPSINNVSDCEYWLVDNEWKYFLFWSYTYNLKSS